jgi:putative ABC transport system permease protein
MTYATLVRRNLLRATLRTALTAGAVAVSIFLVCAVMTLPSVRDAILRSTSRSLRISIHNKAGLVYWMPHSYVQRVRAIPGIVATNEFTWFGGIVTEPKDLFPNFAVDPETIAETWNDWQIDPGAIESFKRMRNAALVGARTMEKFRWKVGDEITLRGTVFPINLTLRIVGVIPSTANPVILWFPRAYLEEAMKPLGGMDRVGMIWARVAAPEDVNRVMLAVDDIFRNSQAETASETERAFFANFMSSFDGIIAIVQIVGFLVVAAIVLIAANTAAMSVRERVGEIAVLKAIGFRPSQVLLLLLCESTAVAGLGGLSGAGLAYFILNAGTGSWSPFLGPLGLFLMPPKIFFEGLSLAVAVGLIAGFVPARGAAAMSVTEALREVH